MTIRKGEEWGSLAVPATGMVTVTSDAELRDLVVSAKSDGRTLPVIGLLGGDMMRTVGGMGDAGRLSGDEPIPHLPIDIVSVTADDGRQSWFVAHLVARGRSWWRGPITAAMNAQFLGRWDVTPRGHPNDGRVDVASVSADLGLQQRWMARARLPLGTHVPHPQIAVRPHATTTLELGGARRIWLDGVRWGSASSLELAVDADALVVCV